VVHRRGGRDRPCACCRGEPSRHDRAVDRWAFCGFGAFCWLRASRGGASGSCRRDRKNRPRRAVGWSRCSALAPSAAIASSLVLTLTWPLAPPGRSTDGSAIGRLTCFHCGSRLDPGGNAPRNFPLWSWSNYYPSDEHPQEGVAAVQAISSAIAGAVSSPHASASRAGAVRLGCLLARALGVSITRRGCRYGPAP